MYDTSGKLIDSRELLKIKLASLVSEIHCIRRAEVLQKNYGRRHALPTPFLLNMLVEHRKLVVRRQARLTGIALGFIRGRTLESLEPGCKRALTRDDWQEVKRMVVKYGASASLTHFMREHDKGYVAVVAEV